jgi:hypothetical protein
MTHAGGRPTKYDPSFCEEVDEYLATTGKEQMHLPKVESFAIWLDVSKKTLYNWAEEHPEFLHSLEKIMVRQAEQLIDDGIYGGKDINSTIVKLLLQNNHGMKERIDETTNDKDLPTPILSVRDVCKNERNGQDTNTD